jgi:hypothetical protein
MWVNIPRRRSKVNTNKPASISVAAIYERSSARRLLRYTRAKAILSKQSKLVIKSVRDIKKFVTECLLLDQLCVSNRFEKATSVPFRFTSIPTPPVANELS